MPDHRNDEATDELADLIGRFFMTIRSGVDTDTLGTLVQLDLTLTQMRVMACLSETDDPRPISEIADALATSLPTAGRGVDHLVRAGLAKRWEDPDDRRTRLVTLTDEGRALVEVHRAAFDAHVRAFTDALPGEVAGALADALARALDAVPESFRSTCSLAPEEPTHAGGGRADAPSAPASSPDDATSPLERTPA